MIEEEAYVEKVGDGVVWVVKTQSSGCSACTQTACPSSVNSGLFAGRQFRLKVASNLALFPGDKVLLGIEDDGLTRISLGIYLLPLLTFFFGAIAGVSLFSSDLAGVLGGFLGLFLYFFGFKALGFFNQESLQAVILRKIN